MTKLTGNKAFFGKYWLGVDGIPLCQICYILFIAKTLVFLFKRPLFANASLEHPYSPGVLEIIMNFYLTSLLQVPLNKCNFTKINLLNVSLWIIN